MKYDCELIRDIIPLYVDDALSEKSKSIIREHFSECPECEKIYHDFSGEEPFKKETGEIPRGPQVGKYARKIRITVLIIVLVLVSCTAIGAVIIGFLAFGPAGAKVKDCSDISKYKECIGKYTQTENTGKWEMDETIFPERITDEMKVIDFRAVSYDPWDAQYISYLTVEYESSAYDAELSRLKSKGAQDYTGIYSVTGAPDGYSVTAMNSDSYHGFVYALTDNSNRITYVEIIFCNYFLDLNIDDYLPQEYRLKGFDAGRNNAYRDKMMSEACSSGEES